MDLLVLSLLLFTWWMRRGEKHAKAHSISKEEQRKILREIERL